MPLPTFAPLFVRGGVDRRDTIQASMTSAARDRSLEHAALRDTRSVRSDRRLFLSDLAGTSGNSRGENDKGTGRGQT